MRRFISFRDFDWVLLAFVLLICGIGVLEIYSATRQTKFIGFEAKQIYWLIGGLLLMFLVSVLNYQALLENVHWFYIASILSLVAVAAIGTRVLGAKRWIRVPGGQHFQPSEWIKLVLILALAKYFSDLAGREVTIRDIVKCFLIAAVPMLLVLKHAFGKLKLHRVEANIQPGNRASIALAKKCGFVREGLSRRMLKVRGRWKDHERWALLAEDFRSSRM